MLTTFVAISGAIEIGRHGISRSDVPAIAIAALIFLGSAPFMWKKRQP